MLRNDSFITSYLQSAEGSLSWANKPLSKKLAERELKASEEKPKVAQDLIDEERKKVAGNLSDLEKKRVAQNSDFNINGTITKVQPSDGTVPVNPIYKNNLFLDNIKEFQTDLLLKESNKIRYTIETMDFEKNDIKYKLLIKPIKEKDGSVAYIYAMASLQPVDEAVQMVQDYYIYIIAFVVVLVFLASFLLLETNCKTATKNK